MNLLQWESILRRPRWLTTYTCYVCHGFGSARERFVARMGMALNRVLYDENKGKEGWVEQLGYAVLSIPAGAALLTLLIA